MNELFLDNTVIRVLYNKAKNHINSDDLIEELKYFFYEIKYMDLENDDDLDYICNKIKDFIIKCE